MKIRTILILIIYCNSNLAQSFSPFDSLNLLSFKMSELRLIRINAKEFYETEKQIPNCSGHNHRIVFSFIKINDSIIPHGEYGAFFDSTLLVKAEIDTGNLKRISFFGYGKTIDEYSVVSNKFNGDYFHYNNIGHLTITGRFKNNVRVGLWIETYGVYNKSLKSKGNYNGKVFFFSLKGNKIMVSNEANKNIDSFNISIVQFNEYLKKNHIKVQIKQLNLPFYYYFKDGIWEYWNENGQLVKKEIWENGILLREEDI
jgi:hypothetical protein